MCGIALCLEFDGRPVDLDRLVGMTRALRHRGPDDEAYLLGEWRSGAARLCGGPETAPGPTLPPVAGSGHAWSLALGVRRLAIRHADIGARQPMAAPGEALWLAYNGELYDVGALRARLRGAGWRFRTRSDTEVLLAAWHTWGSGALEALDGMFAAVIWAPAERRLWCLRDRLGIKPLYYARSGLRLVVASEIKAVRIGLAALPGLDTSVVAEYVATGLTDLGARTCDEAIARLRPGHLLEVADGRVTERRWASPATASAADTSAADRRARFHEAVDAAVGSHLESDRPMGALLSGGLDSGTIVLAAEMRHPHPPLELFTVAMGGEARLNEAALAREVAARASGAHRIVTFEPDDLVAHMTAFATHLDEPVVSPSVVAQWHVMQSVSAHGIRVVLDGQGADELLLGYPGFAGVLRALALPSALRQGFRQAVRALTAVRAAELHGVAQVAATSLPAGLRGVVGRIRSSGRRAGLLPEIAAARTVLDESPDAGPALARERHRLLGARLPALLRYLDATSMAASVEARVPFLARPVVDAARGLRVEDLLQDSRQKWVLRDPSWSRLPDAVRLRTDKIAFATPGETWWRSPLLAWLRQTLDGTTIRRHGLLDPRLVATALDDLASARPGAGRLPFWRWANLTMWMEARRRGRGSQP